MSLLNLCSSSCALCRTLIEYRSVGLNGPSPVVIYWTQFNLGIWKILTEVMVMVMELESRERINKTHTNTHLSTSVELRWSSWTVSSSWELAAQDKWSASITWHRKLISQVLTSWYSSCMVQRVRLGRRWSNPPKISLMHIYWVSKSWRTTA